jgi:glycolate oxidase subunit GlcD
VISAALAADLRRILGDDGVITDPGALLVYESDGLTAYRFTPGAVVLPSTTDHVCDVMRALHAADVAFVPRGAGTGLSGGALALNDAVVISTARMDRILEIDAPNRIARVQPAVINVQLTAAAAPFGLYYAPDPSSQTVCTIGGNVGENAGGPHCLKYGVTLNHIAGVTVVLSDGEIIRLGGAWRDDDGLDLLGLFIGSEGTFGIATEIEVKLERVPEDVRTMLATFDSVERASHAVSAIIAEGMLPAALEMVDRNAIIAIEASAYAAGLPTDIGAALVIEFDGNSAGISVDVERASAVCRRYDAIEVRIAANEAERQKLWYARKKAFGAMGRIAPDLLIQDAVVPRSRLPETLARIDEIAARYELQLCQMFHAGDGNLHPTLPFDRRDPAVVERVERASQEMMQACVDAGGTITGEHGVGLDKRDYMSLIFSDEAMSLMCDVRRAFDPSGRANPAKLLPTHVCREWIGPGTRRA